MTDFYKKRVQGLEMSGEERAMKERLLSEASDLDSMLDNIEMERVMIIRRNADHNARFEQQLAHYLRSEELESVVRLVQQRPHDVNCEDFLTVRLIPTPEYSGVPANNLLAPKQAGCVMEMFMPYIEQTQMMLTNLEQNFAAKMNIYSQLTQMTLVYSPANQPVTEECALVYLSYPGKKNLSVIKIDTQNGAYDLPRETLLPNEMEISRRTIELMSEEAAMEEANFYVAVNPSRMLPKEVFLAKATSQVEQYQKDGRVSSSLERLGDIFGWPYSETDTEGESDGEMEVSRGMVQMRGRRKVAVPSCEEEADELIRVWNGEGKQVWAIDYFARKNCKDLPN